MEQRTPTLGELLQRVKDDPGDREARLQAARLALVLAFHKGDPHFADIAESLLVDAPRRLPTETREALQRLAAQAHAIRRAVAMAHQESQPAPSNLILGLSADPEALVTEITAMLSAGRRQLARAMLEVALARHPGHQGLLSLHGLQHDPWSDADTEH